MSAIKNSNTTYVVISGEISTEPTLQNIQNTAELEFQLEVDGFKFKRGVGRFRGMQESVFMVPVNTYQDVEYLRRTAREYGQESILEIKQGHGWLLGTDGHEEYIGTVFEATGREESYTQVGSKLFTVKREA